MSDARLITLALEAVEDERAIPVLSDLVLEEGIADRVIVPGVAAVVKNGCLERAEIVTLTVAHVVPMLCLRVPISRRPPEDLGERGRSLWTERLDRSIYHAREQWELYACTARKDWARALLCVLLFGSWASEKRLSPFGTRSPWPVVRRWYQHEEEEERERRLVRQRETMARRNGHGGAIASRPAR